MQRFQEIGPPEDVIGDDPRWHRYTPLVWQAIAMDFPHNLPSIAHVSTDGTNPLNTGGYDSYHLEDHSRGPELETFETLKGSFAIVDNRAILVTDSYVGWCRLASGASPPSEPGTSGLDVYCTTEEIHLWDYTS